MNPTPDIIEYIEKIIKIVAFPLLAILGFGLREWKKDHDKKHEDIESQLSTHSVQITSIASECKLTVSHNREVFEEIKDYFNRYASKMDEMYRVITEHNLSAQKRLENHDCKLDLIQQRLERFEDGK